MDLETAVTCTCGHFNQVVSAVEPPELCMFAAKTYIQKMWLVYFLYTLHYNAVCLVSSKYSTELAFAVVVVEK